MPDIKQTVTFNARPGVIFDALMSSKKHSAFTGSPAKIGAVAGRPFSTFGGYISGINLDITKNKTIVQAWRAKNWPKGVWSVASFQLAAAKGGKTKLSFSHTGVPAGSLKGITSGWKGSYWTPLKAALKADSGAAKPKKAAAKAKKKVAAKPKKKAAPARRAKATAARKPATSARGTKSTASRRTSRARTAARAGRRK
jgi:uncharacterized protein YndB with AHSA1/START domain